MRSVTQGYRGLLTFLLIRRFRLRLDRRLQSQIAKILLLGTKLLALGSKLGEILVKLLQLPRQL